MILSKVYNLLFTFTLLFAITLASTATAAGSIPTAQNGQQKGFMSRLKSILGWKPKQPTEQVNLISTLPPELRQMIYSKLSGKELSRLYKAFPDKLPELQGVHGMERKQKHRIDNDGVMKIDEIPYYKLDTLRQYELYKNLPMDQQRRILHYSANPKVLESNIRFWNNFIGSSAIAKKIYISSLDEFFLLRGGISKKPEIVVDIKSKLLKPHLVKELIDGISSDKLKISTIKFHNVFINFEDGIKLAEAIKGRNIKFETSNTWFAYDSKSRDAYRYQEGLIPKPFE